MLKLNGERRFEKDVEEGEFHRVERAYGSFSRAFALPTRVDSERVEASFASSPLSAAHAENTEKSRREPADCRWEEPAGVAASSKSR